MSNFAGKYSREMNIINIILVILLGVAAVTGWRKGFICQIGSLLALVLAVIGCRMAGTEFAEALLPKFGVDLPSVGGLEGKSLVIVCYIVQFVVIYLTIFLLARIIRGVARCVLLGPIDSLAGAGFAVAEWAVGLSLLLNLLVLFCPAAQAACSATLSPAGLICGFAPWLLDVAGFK